MNKYEIHTKVHIRIQEWEKWQTCDRKKAFNTPEQALKHDKNAKVYECPFCNKLHLSSKINKITNKNVPQGIGKKKPKHKRP
jgi:hypothetical protein